MNKPFIKIYVTNEGCKHMVNAPIESPVKIQRTIAYIDDIIKDGSERVTSKPDIVYGTITFRFTRLKNKQFKMNCDYDIASFATSHQSKIVLDLYKDIFKIFSDGSIF